LQFTCVEHAGGRRWGSVADKVITINPYSKNNCMPKLSVGSGVEVLE